MGGTAGIEAKYVRSTEVRSPQDPTPSPKKTGSVLRGRARARPCPGRLVEGYTSVTRVTASRIHTGHRGAAPERDIFLMI